MAIGAARSQPSVAHHVGHCGALNPKPRAHVQALRVTYNTVHVAVPRTLEAGTACCEREYICVKLSASAFSCRTSCSGRLKDL